jgi:DNA-binding MarR family transcriptional regulator
LLTLELIYIKEDLKDRRVKRIFITDKGEIIKKQSIESTMNNLTPVLQNLSVEEIANALAFSNKT